jgi:multidrug transporter EmrE-like cation transporter
MRKSPGLDDTLPLPEIPLSRTPDIMNRNFLYVFGCVAFTVYGQLVLKWRLMHKGDLPVEFWAKLAFLFRALLDPYVLSGFAAAFIASIFWMAAITKIDITVAYPFMSLAFILVLLFSALLFNEPITVGKVLGLALICAGILVTAKL